MDLFVAVMRLNRQMIRFAHKNVILGRGMHHAQANLLSMIASLDGPTQRDLAEEMDVRPSSMTEMLGRLEQSGWIRRVQDENDQRVLRVYLTDAGKKIVDESPGFRSQTAGAIFDCLTDEEKDQLAAFLDKISANLERSEESLKDACRSKAASHCGHHHKGPRGCGHPPFGPGYYCRPPFFGR